MPRPRKPVPADRLHRQSGQAIVTINVNGTRKDVLLGKHASPGSHAEYRRVLAGLVAVTVGVLLTRAVAPEVNEQAVAAASVPGPGEEGGVRFPPVANNGADTFTGGERG